MLLLPPLFCTVHFIHWRVVVKYVPHNLSTASAITLSTYLYCICLMAALVFHCAGEKLFHRPAAEQAAICRQLPTLWQSSCAEAGRTCLEGVVLDWSHEESGEVSVAIDSKDTSLPDIHRKLLPLMQLHPGKYS